MKHNNQIAYFDGAVIIQWDNSSDPNFSKHAWDIIKFKLFNTNLNESPTFEIDDNGDVQKGKLEWNHKSERWEVVNG